MNLPQIKNQNITISFYLTVKDYVNFFGPLMISLNHCVTLQSDAHECHEGFIPAKQKDLINPKCSPAGHMNVMKAQQRSC